MMRLKLKRLGIFVCFCLTLCSLVACGNEERIPLQFKVEDQNGKAVEGALVLVSKDFRELTNENGETKGSFRKQLNITTEATKDGYYRSNGVPVFPYADDFDLTKRIVIVLKEKKNPIAMYVKNWSYGSHPGVDIPGAIGKDIGYDLILGDWVKPYGQGKKSDLIFVREGDWGGNIGDEYSQKLTVKFSNDQDGLIPFEVPLPLFEQNEFRSDYEAPKVGYLNQWVRTSSKVEGGAHETTEKAERNYYFRIRTVVDAKGEIVSCHYGKIYGDFMSMIYYVNPTPNDRNVEFDIERNLFETRDKIDRP